MAKAGQGPGRLAEVFSSNVRAEVLTAMFADPTIPWSLTELARALDLAVSSVQHEVYKLERLGILTGRREGASRRYRLTLEEPLTQALKDLVLVANGVERILDTLFSRTDGLESAMVASSEREGGQQVALILVGKLDLMTIAEVQERVAAVLEVPPASVAASWFTPDVWQQHVADGHPLVLRLQAMTPIVRYGAHA